MDLKNRSIALYGRFSAGQRDRLQNRIVRHGGRVARDLTRRSDLLVIGTLAVALIDCGALPARVKSAKARGVPIMGERAFAAALDGTVAKAPSTLPLASALGSTSLSADDTDILAAFDLIALQGDKISFGDARTLRTAADILAQGRSLSDAVRILLQAELAPVGRHKLVLMSSGSAALQWEHGLSTLEGQGLLPLESAQGIDELFEAAQISEAGGDNDEASRLYDMCARAERSDAIALYNLGNIRLKQGAHPDAVLAYRRAVARDSDFVEARYNLALALESSGKLNEALEELALVLDRDPNYSDAVFNRAQMLMKAGEIAGAKVLYMRYLELDPPDDWAATARKAITYCSARLSA